MDDYITFYLVVGGNGSKYSKYIGIKITEEITKLMEECQSMGIKTLGPDVNESYRVFG